MRTTMINTAIAAAIRCGLLTSFFIIFGIAERANAQSGVTPTAGDISISEVMFDPATPVDDNDGEYFEVTNVSSKILDFSNLYIQDSETPGSASAPYFKIPSGTLPPMYPGERFVFARSGDSALNGGIPIVHYVYSVTTGSSVPPDKSKVSHTGLSFSNSAVESIAITTGSPFNLGGSVVEMITYDPTKAPFNNHSGIGFERANLLGPWAAGNVAPSSASFGTLPQSGTPGSYNSNDVTLYPCYYNYPPVNPGSGDTGILGASGPASIHAGTATIKLTHGAPGELYALAVSTTPVDMPMLNGTVLVDLLQSDFWALDSYKFDANGNAELTTGVPPQLAGMTVYLQWYCFDFNQNSWIFSNGLGVDVVP
ncbi:MAG: lamin tail domain-containing protein [Planctomycetes bacterium]|nr:lamin tail domain-containing protein [Planctomycetota bacterium]